MSRVKDNRDAERVQEQKRIEKENQSRDQKKSDSFSKMMNQRRGGEQKQAVKQGPKQPAQAKTKSSASGALLARQGITSNSFAATLQKQGAENLQYSESLSTGRGDEMSEKRVESSERQDGQEMKKLGAEHDRVEGLDRDDPQGQGQGQGRGDGDKSGGGGQEKQDGHKQGDGQGPTGPGAIENEASAEVGGPRQPKLPANIIQEIVNRVFVGANTEGLSQFHIEFKEEILGGLRLEISAENGKISAKFITSDKNIGRLLKASEGQLSRAFGHKGMSLDSLSVETR